MRGSRRASRLAAQMAACCLALACSRPQPARSGAEAPPPVSAPTEAPPAQARSLAPPRPDEVAEVVKRVFKGTASLGEAGKAPFTAGDFNGDLSQDLAFVVRPVPERVAEMNAAPRWMLKDARVAEEPGAPPLRVEANETLLAVVHGEGPDGWRNPEATQTWLLKNAAGSQLQTRPAREFLAANQGRAVPRIHGDLIAEVMGAAQGCLYYTGASYAWYDPQTFKYVPEPRMAHRTQPR